MNHPGRFAFYIIFLLLLIVGLILPNFMSGQTLSNESIVKELKNMHSYGAEGEMLANGVLHDKVTSNYVKGQSEHLTDTITSEYSNFSSMNVPKNRQPDVKKILSLNSSLLLAFNTLTNHTDNKNDISQAQTTFIKTVNSIDTLIKHYE